MALSKRGTRITNTMKREYGYKTGKQGFSASITKGTLPAAKKGR